MSDDYRIESFKFEHMELLNDAAGKILMPPTEAVALEQQDFAFTGFHGDQIIGAAGLIKMWHRRYWAWAHVDKTSFAAHKLYAVRTIRRFLDLFEGRVEATVPVGFEGGIRLARACGFHVECERMEKFFADGQDATLFVRVN